MQTRSLKDIQPQICQAMDSLLAELNSQEDIQVNRSFQRNQGASFRPRQQSAIQQHQQTGSQQPFQQRSFSKQKSCILCKSSGRAHLGHDISTCWHISKFDKLEMVRALQVSDDELNDTDYPVAAVDSTTEADMNVNTVSAIRPILLSPSTSQDDLALTRRVSSKPSPFICAFYKHIPCKILIDAGATSSMVSLHFVKRSGIPILSTQQGARQMDKSAMKIRGEVKFTVLFGDLRLVIEALITDTLDCDVLGGVPFGVANQVIVDLAGEQLSIMGRSYSYGAAPEPVHEIRRADSVILRNNKSRVVYPS